MCSYITTVSMAIRALKNLVPNDNFIHVEDEDGNQYVWDSITRKATGRACGDWDYVMKIRKVDGCVCR